MKKFKPTWKLATIVLGVLLVIVSISKCGGNSDKKYSEAEVQEIVNQVVAQARAEAQALNNVPVSDSVTVEEDNNVSQEATVQNGSKYEFKWLGSTATLILDKAEGTAQLVFKGKTYYGQCYFDEINKEWGVGGFTGTDEIDMTSSHNGLFNGESWLWVIGKPIDSKNNYLYMGGIERKANNPNYRIELTPVQ